MRLDMDELRALKAKHLLSLVPDPQSDLVIANYLPAAQYGKAWDEYPVLLDCRGTILRPDGTVHAKPLRKFFSVDERPETSLEALSCLPAPEVAHKLDGCFNRNTRLSLWDGGTISIGEVVSKKLTPVLIGMDGSGKLVPSQVVGHLASKRKPTWMHIHIDRPLRTDGKGATCPPVMWVTPNHHIWVNGVCGPIGNAQVGDKLVGHEVKPSSSVRHLLESGLLGDGSVTRNGTHYHYQESHKATHREYVDDVIRCLGPMAIRACDTVSGHGTPLVWANSRNHRICDELRAKWYPCGKKEVPDDLSWVDDYTVARWFMDDGSLSHYPAQQDRALFATNGFSQDGVIRLAERLSEMYGVFCTVYQSKGWCLRINAGRDGQIDRFWQAISPHVVPCMRYKLPERYRLWPYTPYPDGSMSYEPVDVSITDIRFINAEDMGNGRNCGFDVQTTTGNYLAQGVLVHNSMITLFHDPSTGAIRFATRGSFTSDQAQHAARIWAERYSHVRLNSEATYLFELVAPYNRIVVAYEQEDLVLIGIVRNKDGFEYSYNAVQETGRGLGLPVVQTERVDWRAISEMARPNFEGFVLFWPGHGVRAKAKLSEYVRLHATLSGTSALSVWETLRDGGTIESFLDGVPDEFASWVRATSMHILTAKEEYVRLVQQEFESLPRFDTRREFAQAVQRSPRKSALFSLLDGKSIDRLSWMAAKPTNTASTPRLEH